MRFSIRTSLLIVVFCAICFAIVARITRDSPERWHCESDLHSMGAYYVGFIGLGNKPDWVSFVGPVRSAQIAKYQSSSDIDFAGANMADDSVRNIASLKRVGTIHLTNCDVTDNQIDLLAKTGCVEMQRLNGSPVTDDAIPAIASIS